MASFGANLRREREMRGVPLEEIAGATKISIRSLQALEAEEFSKLLGGIFTRSFIRAYARYLGLDEETVIGEYQAVAPPSEEVDLSRLTRSKPKPAKESSRTTVLGLLIAVLLLAGGYALFRYSRRAVESPVSVSSASRTAPPASSASQQASTAPAVPTATSPTLAQPALPTAGTTSQPAMSATATTSQPATPRAPEAGQGTANPKPQDASKPPPLATPGAPSGGKAGEADSNLVLQVAASEQAWVAVDADGKTVLQRILKPNDIQTFKATKSFDVITGNAQGIILTLNGETLKPLGHRGEVKKVHVTRDDLRNP